MEITGTNQRALFCQDCAIEFTTCMGIALQHASKIMEADENVVH